MYYLSSEQQRRWSDCGNAQADLHLCCSHILSSIKPVFSWRGSYITTYITFVWCKLLRFLTRLYMISVKLNTAYIINPFSVFSFQVWREEGDTWQYPRCPVLSPQTLLAGRGWCCTSVRHRTQWGGIPDGWSNLNIWSVWAEQIQFHAAHDRQNFRWRPWRDAGFRRNAVMWYVTARFWQNCFSWWENAAPKARFWRQIYFDTVDKVWSSKKIWE